MVRVPLVLGGGSSGGTFRYLGILIVVLIALLKLLYVFNLEEKHVLNVYKVKQKSTNSV